jgi:hypothetical protein
MIDLRVIILFFSGGVVVFFACVYLTKNTKRTFIDVLNELSNRKNMIFNDRLSQAVGVKYPDLSGIYNDRVIRIKAESRRTFWCIHLIISVEIDNQGRGDLPRGAFLLIKRKKDYNIINWIRQKLREINTQLNVREHYSILSVPLNLANNMLAIRSLNNLLGRAKMKEIVLAESNIVYRQSGLEGNVEILQKILNELCQTADNFERFSRAWIK